MGITERLIAAGRGIRIRPVAPGRAGVEITESDARGPVTMKPYSDDPSHPDIAFLISGAGTGTANIDGNAATASLATAVDNVNLTAFGALTGAADKGIYFTGVGALATYTLTSYGRSLCAAADASAARTLLSLGTIATQSAASVAITGGAITGTTIDGVSIKSYVDSLIAGLKWKATVKVATTANVTLATGFANGQTIDGVTLVTNDRVLAKDQTAGAENGIYIVPASGAPTRATDADAGSELVNATVVVEQGTVNSDKAFVCTNNSITLGSTSIVFTNFASTLTGALLATNNLSDLGSASTARTNLGLAALALKATVATADIDDASVTLAKLANLAQDQFIVRTTASTGVPQTATCTAAARTVLDDTTVAAMVDTLGGSSSSGTGGIVRTTSPTLITPALGTPSAAVLTSATGLPLTTGVTGTLPVANGGTGVTTSTGSGANALATSPTLVTPILGTPTSGTLTNCTGLPVASVVGIGTVATLASDTDTTLAANSDSRVATQKATKAYVDAAVTGLLDFKGSTDCSATPNYPTGLKGDAYYVSVAGKIGGASGKSVEIGDVYVASADNAGGTEASVGTSWFVLEHNLVGAAVTSGTLAQFAATTSAQLAGVISDETGSGALVFATSPTLVTPNLGTPSALVLTNATGLTTAGILVNAITLARMAQMATASFIGRSTAGTGDPEVLSASTARTLLSLVPGTDVAAYTDSRLDESLWTKRQMQIVADPSGGTVTNIGFRAAPTIAGNTIASTLQDSGACLALLTSGVSGNVSGLISTTFDYYRRDWDPTLVIKGRTYTNVTSIRFWIGMVSADLSAIATPTTQHCAAFSYDSTRDGTANWRSVTCDGATATLTDTGVAVSTSTAYTFRVVVDSSVPNVKFYINGTLVATHTANLPGATTGMGHEVHATNLTASARGILFTRLGAIEA